MHGCRCAAIAGSVAILVLVPGFSALAEPSYSVIGSGFTGRPFVLRDDIVLETDGVTEAIRDFSDPKSPGWIGWNEHGYTLNWSHVLVDGDYVVGLNADRSMGPVGFSVNDFTWPDAPVELGVDNSVACESGWLSGPALVLANEDLLLTFDLTVPSAPTMSDIALIGHREGNRWPARIGETLYLIDAEATVRVLDVSDPLHPVDRGTLPAIPGRIDAMVGEGQVLHLLVALEGESPRVDLVTWDLGAGGEPVETARHRLDATGAARGRTLAVDGELLLASAGDALVQAFGLADPTAPEPGWSLGHDSDHVAISDHAVFVTAADTLLVYRRTPADRTPEGPVRRTALPRFLTVAGEGPVQIAQLRDDASVLVSVDVSDPTHPSLGVPFDTGLTGTLAHAAGVGLMTRDEDEFQLLDLSNPSEPALAGTVPRSEPDAYASLHADDVLLVRHLSTGVLDLYDVGDPEQPQWAASLDERSPLFCDGRWLVCGNNRGELPRVYRLDEDLQPELKGRLDSQLFSAHRCRVVDDHAFLLGYVDADLTREVEVHRLGAPATLVKKVPLEDAMQSVDVFRGHLFVQGNHDCLVFDITDPAGTHQVGSIPIPLPSNYRAFGANGDVATISTSLITVLCTESPAAPVPDLPAGAGVRLAPARPNPFNPRTTISFVLDHERDLTVSVYDARGRLVDVLARGRFEPGDHSLAWDARSGGAPAASGVYYVRVSGTGVEAVQAVTMVK